MARRLLRDYPLEPGGNPRGVAEGLRTEMRKYLEIGRQAYLEMDRRTKPECDLIADGCQPVEEIAREIVEAIKARAFQIKY